MSFWYHLATAVGLGLALSGCGGDDAMPPMRDSGPVYVPAEAHPQVAFEGQTRLAVEIFGPGEDWSTATVRVEDPGGPLEILEQRCRGERCGVVLRVADQRPNMGIPIPSTIDTMRAGLIISGGSEEYRALMTIFPLDTIDNRGTMPLNVDGVVLASAAATIEGSTFRASSREAPIRWVVFGDATFAGTIDASAEGAEPRAGGAAGGAVGVAGEGQGGSPGVGGSGAGGGGAGEAGEAGAAADGTPLGGGGGGAGDAAASAACAELLEEATCGGGGGGGAAGMGGAGGGTLLVAALGTLRIGGGTFIAHGADGVDGGGGGAGGNVILAAPTVEGAATLGADGGAGGGASATAAMGGAGAAGRTRVDATTSSVDGTWRGPAVDVSAVSSISDDALVTLTGRAAPSATVRISALEGGASASATADAGDGSFSVDVTLSPGMNRLAVEATADGATVRSWVGTNFELETIPALRQALPRGATVDIVYLP